MSDPIRVSLEALTAAIPRGDAETLRREMAFLDGVVREPSSRLHPQLAHFLGNRSYAKALMWVTGQANIPAGICGGGRSTPPSHG